jgi:transposase-like protein
MPRVMNVDKSPAYPAAVEALKADGAITGQVILRQCKYLNNVIEQDQYSDPSSHKEVNDEYDEQQSANTSAGSVAKFAAGRLVG